MACRQTVNVNKEIEKSAFSLVYYSLGCTPFQAATSHYLLMYSCFVCLSLSLARPLSRSLSHTQTHTLKFADGSPSGRSSQFRVDGATNSICGRDMRIHSY